MEHHRAWYCTYLLFMHIYCFSVQLFTTELQGMVALIILHHSFIPDVSHSSSSCCAWGRTLIGHKVLIKNNTEPNQSDILPVLLFMWQHLQCLFINSLICSTWMLLVFLFLLSSKEKCLTVSQDCRRGSSQWQHQAQLDPQRAVDGRSPQSLVPSQWCGEGSPRAQCQRGWLGTDRTPPGMPVHTGVAQGLGQWEGLAAMQGQAASWDHLSLF